MLTRVLGDHIELRTALDRRPADVRVDPGQIEQAIMNLVMNARDAMPDGGVITVGTQLGDDTPPNCHAELARS